MTTFRFDCASGNYTIQSACLVTALVSLASKLEHGLLSEVVRVDVASGDSLARVPEHRFLEAYRTAVMS